MEMSEKLAKLKELQEVLAEKYDFEAKLEELPKSLEGSTASLERFKQDFIAKNSEYETKKAEVANKQERKKIYPIIYMDGYGMEEEN